MTFPYMKIVEEINEMGCIDVYYPLQGLCTFSIDNAIVMFYGQTDL